MIYFLRGKVAIIEQESIVIDVRDVGYQMLVSHIEQFHVGDEVLVYTYNVVREDANYLIGFLAKEEKEIFLKELKTKGVFFLNDYSELKNKYDMVNFHEYCWINTVKSFVAFKIYGYGKTFGYLTFVDKRRKRIWQKEDIMIFSVVAKMLGFSIHYDRYRKKINRGK